jgi:hypothetical protein
MFEEKTTEEKYNDFLEWKSINLGSYNMEQVEVLRKIRQAVCFKNNIELATFMMYLLMVQ